MPGGNVLQRYFYELGVDLETFRRSTSQADDILQSFASRSLGTVAKLGSGIGIALGLGAVVDGFKRLGQAVVSANADLEVYEERLRTVLKSQEAAVETLERVRKFAAETPFEIPDLVSATVQLEAFGQSSRKWLPLVAEASAAMAMDITDMSRAVARALSGSAEGFEVLRNAGISSARLLAAGWSGTYNDVESTMTALENVLGEFSGGMERQAKTWPGILSMVSDAFTQFEYLIGDRFFPVIKSVLQSIQDRLQGMLRTGEAQRWATRIAAILNTAVQGFQTLLTVVDTVGRGLDRFFSLFESRRQFADLSAMLESFQGARDEIDANISKVEALRQRYADLEAQARANGQTVAEAAQSNEELRQVMNQLVEIVPEAATGFDEYGNALGISTDRISRFLEAQRELQSELLKNLGRQYRDQLNEINAGIGSTVSEMRHLSEVVNTSMDDWVSRMESGQESSANLAAALGDLTGDAQRAMAETGESFDEAFNRLRDERLRRLFDAYQQGIAEQLQQSRRELQSYNTALAVTQDALQRFIRVSGLEDALETVREFSQYPGPQTVADTNQLAVAYARVADVFGLDFMRAQEQVRGLTDELLKIQEMDVAKPQIAPERAVVAPVVPKDALAKVTAIFKEMTVKAQEEAAAQGRIWEQSAQEMLDMYDRATEQAISETKGITAEDLRSFTGWREQRVKLVQDVLKEQQTALEQQYRDERFALENSQRYRQASTMAQMRMLGELEERYQQHREIRESISRELVQMELQLQDEIKDAAFESLDERSKKEHQVKEMLKAEGSAYGRFLVNLVQTTTQEQVDALLLRFRREVEQYRFIKETAETTERDVTEATKRANKRRQEIYEETAKVYRQSIQAMIEERQNQLEAGGTTTRTQDEIEAENRLRVILHTLDSDAADTYQKLGRLRLDEIQGVYQLGVMSVSEYRSILEAKLASENTFLGEKFRILEILSNLERDDSQQRRRLASADARLMQANLRLYERGYTDTYTTLRSVVGQFFDFARDQESRATMEHERRLTERRQQIMEYLADEGYSYENLQAEIAGLLAKKESLTEADEEQVQQIENIIDLMNELQGINSELAKLEERWISDALHGLSELGNAMSELGLVTEDTNLILQDTLTTLSQFASGDYASGTLSFIRLFKNLLDTSRDGLNEIQKATHQGLLSRHDQVERDLREFTELSTVIEATRESWEQYRYTLKILGDTEKNRIIAQDEQLAYLERFRDTVIRVFQTMKSGIESDLGSIISDAILGGLDEDLGVAVRRAVYRNVINEIVAAFVAQDVIQRRINRIVEEGFKAIDSRPGTWKFDQAIRNIQTLSGGLVSDIERGTAAIGQAIRPLTDTFQQGFDKQLGALTGTVRDKTEEISGITRSLAQAITEPQGNMLISLWTASTDYLRDIKVNTFEMRMILESIRRDGIPSVGPTVTVNQTSGNGDLEGATNDELRAAGLAIAV